MNLEKYASLSFFTGLCATDIQLLAPYFAPQAWVAGTVIFEQGDFAENLFLVVSGEVTIRFKPEDGPIMTVTRVQPGGLFGWSAAMGNPTYTSGAVCSLDSEVLHIRGSDLRMLCGKYPALGQVILERLSAIMTERQQSRQSLVNSMLTNGLRQQSTK
jgi:CRP-like cAMP-binding protein